MLTLRQSVMRAGLKVAWPLKGRPIALPIVQKIVACGIQIASLGLTHS